MTLKCEKTDRFPANGRIFKSERALISDSVLLGRASRARRARSASKRAPPPPPHLYVPARYTDIEYVIN